MMKATNQQVSSELCMDDEALSLLRKQTTEEVIPQSHGEAVVASNLEASDPLEWTVTVKIFRFITNIDPKENYVVGNETQH